MAAPQFEFTAVNLKNKSHTITARVTIAPGGAQGVLLAHGGWFAGYALFVQDDRLVYVHNYLGLQEYRVTSTVAVPRGDCVLALHLHRTGEHQGRAELRIDGVVVGEGLIERTIPAVINISCEGLCCGYDSGLPVSASYEAPFRFTGTIHDVVVEVDDPSLAVDTDAQLRAAMYDQ
jgi:arylsulfatase